MRGGDRQYIAWNAMPIVNGTRYFERVILDNAIGVAAHLLCAGGAAGNVKGYTTNLDNTLPLPIDADTTATWWNLASMNATVSANGQTMSGLTTNNQPTCCARFFMFEFTASASGTATLVISVRRFVTS